MYIKSVQEHGQRHQNQTKLHFCQSSVWWDMNYVSFALAYLYNKYWSSAEGLGTTSLIPRLSSLRRGRAWWGEPGGESLGTLHYMYDVKVRHDLITWVGTHACTFKHKCFQVYYSLFFGVNMPVVVDTY